MSNNFKYKIITIKFLSDLIIQHTPCQVSWKHFEPLCGLPQPSNQVTASLLQWETFLCISNCHDHCFCCVAVAVSIIFSLHCLHFFTIVVVSCHHFYVFVDHFCHHCYLLPSPCPRQWWHLLVITIFVIVVMCVVCSALGGSLGGEGVGEVLRQGVVFSLVQINNF